MWHHLHMFLIDFMYYCCKAFHIYFSTHIKNIILFKKWDPASRRPRNLSLGRSSFWRSEFIEILSIVLLFSVAFIAKLLCCFKWWKKFKGTIESAEIRAKDVWTFHLHSFGFRFRFSLLCFSSFSSCGDRYFTVHRTWYLYNWDDWLARYSVVPAGVPQYLSVVCSML